jgi:hypothetical protein
MSAVELAALRNPTSNRLYQMLPCRAAHQSDAAFREYEKILVAYTSKKVPIILHTVMQNNGL